MFKKILFKLPSLSYGNYLLKHSNYTMKNSSFDEIEYLILQKSLANVNIFYEILNYDVSTELPALSLLNFILNIGYTFGLFFGNYFINFQ